MCITTVHEYCITSNVGTRQNPKSRIPVAQQAAIMLSTGAAALRNEKRQTKYSLPVETSSAGKKKKYKYSTNKIAIKAFCIMPPPTRGKKRQRPATTDSSTEDWISQLAKQASGQTAIPTKEERVERRNAKKLRRQEKKRTTNDAHLPRDNVLSKKVDKKVTHQQEVQSRLTQLSSHVETCVKRINNVEETKTTRPKLYNPEQPKKGKATANNQWNEDVIQPRPSDYGGLGLARQSLYIALRDPSFLPKLEEEFAEHIQGFFGKQRTKAMKKQLDGNMLWRQLAEKRVNDTKVNGRKLGDMSVDERVEAMLEAGMV